MRVLWLVRDNLCSHPGGDTTQILKTCAALRALGVSINLTNELPAKRSRNNSDVKPSANDLEAKLSSYDLVHQFHLDRLWEHLPVCRELRSRDIPAVLSTIYWPADEFDRGGRAGLQGRLARLLGSERYQTARLLQRFAMQHLRTGGVRHWDRRLLSFRAAARYLLETVRAILPNSRAEQDIIEQRFGVARPATIVPNAADTTLFGGASPGAEARSGVLCVGRIEPRKNQLALIEALAGTNIPLALVGQAGRFNRGYADRCRVAAGANVRFLAHCAPEELRTLYHGARAHACVSWYETPGLASLEAALCGCQVVATPGGSTREYFGDDAFFCEPDDRRSIRQAVEAALRAAPRPELARRVGGEFTWEAAARATLKGYETALRAPSAV